MPLASLDDINNHLPLDKLEVLDAQDELLQVDALRIVRGYLAGVFEPATLASWASPETTPELIRSIAGRLIAAAYYAKSYSEDDPDVPEYAQKLYNEAINMLERITGGTLTLLDAEGDAIVIQTHSFGELDFYPRDDTDRKFTMSMEF